MLRVIRYFNFEGRYYQYRGEALKNHSRDIYVEVDPVGFQIKLFRRQIYHVLAVQPVKKSVKFLQEIVFVEINSFLIWVSLGVLYGFYSPLFGAWVLKLEVSGSYPGYTRHIAACIGKQCHRWCLRGGVRTVCNARRDRSWSLWLRGLWEGSSEYLNRIALHWLRSCLSM